MLQNIREYSFATHPVVGGGDNTMKGEELGFRPSVAKDV